MPKKNSLEIIYEDEQLLLVNKPANLLTLPDRFIADKPNLLHQLQECYDEIFVVHRIDKETSGILCFAKTAEAHRILSRQFENRAVKKVYLALAEGQLINKEGIIDKALAEHPGQPGKMIIYPKGKKAISFYRVIKQFKSFTLVEVEILTGRMHQIRVHFQSIGHPLAVDPLYNKRSELFLSEIKRRNYQTNRRGEEKPLMSRTTLHAWRLSLKHPVSHELLTREASLPKDFRAVVNQLQKWNS